MWSLTLQREDVGERMMMERDRKRERGKRRGRRDIWCGILLIAPGSVSSLSRVAVHTVIKSNCALHSEPKPLANLQYLGSAPTIASSPPLAHSVPATLVSAAPQALERVEPLPNSHSAPASPPPFPFTCCVTHSPEGLGELSSPLHSQKLTQPGHLYLITTHNTLLLVTQLCNLLFLEKWVRV